MKLRFPIALSLSLALAGCAMAPKPLQGQFSSLTPEQAVQRQAAGERVRWGGRVVHVETQAERSCFEIVGFTLDIAGRPLPRDHSDGRFLACRAGFYDPEVFAAGREVTITGAIEGFETRKVGDYDYRYPRVAAETVYLWPERKDVDIIYRPRPTPWYPWWVW